MCLYTVKRFTRLACNTLSYARLKIHKAEMTELKSEKKIHICSECNKPKEEIRSSRNSSKCCCSCKPEKHDYIEDVVCKETDIKENEMKLLPLGDAGTKILLIKQKGELHAIGTKCTHYGALLHTGALGDGRIRCPWHGACFNIKTGDIEDYPGLDSLPCYKVNVDDTGLVRVKANRKDLDLNRRVKKMSKLDANNKTTVVIVGGGPAAATCAESLRQEGFTGNIVMVCKENTVPYDRVKVSKVLDFDIEQAALRPQSFYDDHSIQVKLGLEATGLNTSENVVTLSNNEILTYNYLFICTGSKPRMPDIPGINLSNIYVLRNYTDSHAIHSKLSDKKHIVILGLGFIGMEAAAYCVSKCASVTIVGRGTIPLQSVFGTAIGNRVREEFEAKGIKFIFKNNITQFVAKEDKEDTVGTVILTDGTVLPADIAIIGIGSTFYTDWIKDSSIEMLQDGSVIVNKHLKTNVENVYAGGDIAYAPLFDSDSTSAAIGHYSLAHYHGKIAALNICAKSTELNSVPYFWTTLFGKSYRYTGYGKPDKIRIYGSLENLEFFAYYIKDGKIIAMSSVGADPVVSDFANFLYEGNSLTDEMVDKNPFGWMRTKPKDLVERFQNVSIVDP
ncbi:apoptosis-inducing factor 3 isoform X1 [Hylaeus volcanicus]|uniref:apoptosis-inducing factor 3 isoform X1 n=1 Tax=Hylaeus volcanicus TaxID=313075 RepID=UPI0023B80D94|nr:apoptosis-inducing factor 3 isoform X1 [Hylaeus volcanicus]XP_053986030.1 apoptosis-inducing factor 3 isoform X1 [Hylaeus volcanicus]XP_053986032.1 apoptosis-inducing factor 3 isoform X1 [Hylaeus volcanicus]